jgi:DNA polymerase-1
MALLHGGVRFPVDAPCPDNVTRLDTNALPMVADMHRYGIRLDVPKLQSLTLDFRAKQKDELEPAILSHLGAYQYRTKSGLIPFKVSSPDHVSQFLFEHLIVQGSDDVDMTPKGKRYTTDDETLGRFRKRHPVISLILSWREYDKLASTYTEPLSRLADGDGFLHPRFNVTAVATGRLSASYVQTIPTGPLIRQCFLAPKDCVLVSTDLSQIEMRMMAHLSHDVNMSDVFRAGGDIHVRTACATFGLDYGETLAIYSAFDSEDRQYLTPAEVSWCKEFKSTMRLPSKNTGFGVIYETSAGGLQALILQAILDAQPGTDPDEVLRDWPESRTQGLIDAFYVEYPGIREYQEIQHTRAQRYCMVWDLFGRVRLVPEARSALKKIKNEGLRKCSNHPDQGSSQGLIKLSMAAMNPHMRRMHKSAWCTPALQIHDDILSMVHKSLVDEYVGMAKWEMEHSAPLDVPVLSSAGVGERWSDL